MKQVRWFKIAGIAVAVLVLTVAISYSWIISVVGGAFDPDGHDSRLSSGAQAMIDRALEGIDPGRLKDYHVHVIGVDRSKTGNWVNPRLLNWWGLHSKVRADVFLHSSGVSEIEQFNDQYLDRLTSLIKAMPMRGKYQLLAFDYFHTPDGRPDPERSEFYVSNDHVAALTDTHPEFFTAAVSIHPYRKDAVEQIEYWAARGVRFIKWLPNAQGMDPDSTGVDAYYEAMRRTRMILLTHVGQELAVSSSGDAQALGNPLSFTRALDKGVKIIMAHAASAGQGQDENGVLRDNFQLFMRLMDSSQYDGNLFGEISALTQFNRLPGPLTGLLERPDIHHRLVNGSDYPLPAINILISTKLLAYYGFITEEEKHLLNEIYRANPLLFDFVVKRTLRHPTLGTRFPASVFMINQSLEAFSN